MKNKVVGYCECGMNQVEFSSLPITRFICHCLVCQAYTGQPYSDVSVFATAQIMDMDVRATTFKRYKLPPNIQRGLCKHCLQPSIEFGVLGQFILIATKNIKAAQALPEPQMHIFYHRRVGDIDDDLPKHTGFIKSQLQAAKIILQGLIATRKSS